MALFKVSINGVVKGVVEAPSKAQGKTWGKQQVEVTVEPATADDINALDGAAIVKVEKAAPAAAAEAK